MYKIVKNVPFCFLSYNKYTCFNSQLESICCFLVYFESREDDTNFKLK